LINRKEHDICHEEPVLSIPIKKFVRITYKNPKEKTLRFCPSKGRLPETRV